MSFNGLLRVGVIYKLGSWCGLDDVEFATLDYVDWFSNRRLHGQIEQGPGFTTPAAFETALYDQIVPTNPVGTQ